MFKNNNGPQLRAVVGEICFTLTEMLREFELHGA
jgi:hypothetical protein